MIQSILGIVDKMRIDICSDSNYVKVKSTIFVQLNPNKYTVTQNVVFNEGQPIGASSAEMQFNRIDAEKVSFEFLFDGTGVVPPGKIQKGGGAMSLLQSVAQEFIPATALSAYIPKSIEKDLEEFKNLLMGYNGDKHQTSYLHLVWGGYNLKGRLSGMEIQHTLFDNSGRPLRAVAKCDFVGSVSYKMMMLKQGKNSPDMTHERVYSMNDKIPVMAADIYESPEYYIDVARSNLLLSFRTAPVGKTLLFPPIK